MNQRSYWLIALALLGLYLLNRKSGTGTVGPITTSFSDGTQVSSGPPDVPDVTG